MYIDIYIYIYICYRSTNNTGYPYPGIDIEVEYLNILSFEDLRDINKQLMIHPVSITRFPLRRFSPGAGLLRNRFVHR